MLKSCYKSVLVLYFLFFLKMSFELFIGNYVMGKRSVIFLILCSCSVFLLFGVLFTLGNYNDKKCGINWHCFDGVC